MSQHADHVMHPNSLAAFDRESEKLTRRAAMIHGALIGARRPLTDREVKALLGFEDMNSVRPRITELISDGYAEEVAQVECPVTHKRVRQVRGLLNRKPRQLTQAELL
jgi:hypothetical protein